MAYQFDCTVAGCDYTAQGDTPDQVFEQMREHAEKRHPEMDVSEEEVRENAREI